MQAQLPRLKKLRQLQVPLDLTAATLAALAPLTALTMLHLARVRSGHMVMHAMLLGAAARAYCKYWLIVFT
jgi:hypothetical protein